MGLTRRWRRAHRYKYPIDNEHKIAFIAGAVTVVVAAGASFALGFYRADENSNEPKPIPSVSSPEGSPSPHSLRQLNPEPVSRLGPFARR